jgi:hypothetical protein
MIKDIYNWMISIFKKKPKEENYLMINDTDFLTINNNGDKLIL